MSASLTRLALARVGGAAAIVLGLTLAYPAGARGAQPNPVFPQSGLQGPTLTVVVSGIRIQPGAECSFGAGITVTACGMDASGKLTAKLIIAPNAVLGYRTVNIRNPGGSHAKLPRSFKVTLAMTGGGGGPGSGGGGPSGGFGSGQSGQAGAGGLSGSESQSGSRTASDSPSPTGLPGSPEPPAARFSSLPSNPTGEAGPSEADGDDSGPVPSQGRSDEAPYGTGPDDQGVAGLGDSDPDEGQALSTPPLVTQAVPNPATLVSVLAGIAALAVLLFRRRRRGSCHD